MICAEDSASGEAPPPTPAAAWAPSPTGPGCRSPPAPTGSARPSPVLARAPVRGMLTGPVPLLAWSFLRDDQPLAEARTAGRPRPARRGERPGPSRAASPHPRPVGPTGPPASVTPRAGGLSSPSAPPVNGPFGCAADVGRRCSGLSSRRLPWQ
ncbi:hypothetical protein AB0L59_40960 [Streptomyces sp. NPDC052109]|uniref:hypothetical protein n=1 Tax=Streptomyces sp. NPDC052109 TaxID=3155527 RepID=UPI00343C7CAF